jgi:DNA-directed RNA polymerase subunit RPC12/RpoP
MSESKEKYEENDKSDPKSRLEFIELFPSRSRETQKQVDTHKPPPPEKTAQSDTDDLPEFPVTAEMWEEFDKTLDEPSRGQRHDYIEDLKKKTPDDCIETQARQIGERAGVKLTGPDKVDKQLPEGDYKPWDIIINKHSREIYGFSPDEYGTWINQRNDNLLEITCSNCSRKLIDNPFTGFQSCPHCGEKIHVMDIQSDELLKARQNTFREAQRSAQKGKGFMTTPLDIPAFILESLSLPKFKFRLVDYYGLIAPLLSLFFFFIAWLSAFVFLTDPRIRIVLFALLGLAFALNYLAIHKSTGVNSTELTQNGIKLISPGKVRVLRYERIVSIGVRNHLSLIGALKQANKFLVVIIAPFAFIVYILTLGNVNLYSVFDNPHGASFDDSDYVQDVIIKTRGLSVTLRINKSIVPSVSKLLGLLIYMTLHSNPHVNIEPSALFAAQKRSNVK